MNAAQRWLVAFAMIATLGSACGTASINELPEAALHCTFEPGECDCDGSLLEDEEPRVCSAQSIQGVCCDLGYHCSCKSVGCTESGTLCTCGAGEGPASQCQHPSGVCCVDASAGVCRCYSELTLCPPAEQPIGNCTIAVLTCDVLTSGGGEPVTSCSAVEVVEYE